MSQPTCPSAMPLPITVGTAASDVALATQSMNDVDPALWDGGAARTFSSQRTRDLAAAALAQTRIDAAVTALTTYNAARVAALLAFQGISPGLGSPPGFATQPAFGSQPAPWSRPSPVLAPSGGGQGTFAASGGLS